MDMVPVGAEWGAAVKDADPEYPKGIQQGDHQDGKSDRGGGIDGKTHIGGIGHVDEFHDQNGIDRTHQQRAGISHEYFSGLEIKDQESQQTAGQGKGDHGIGQHSDAPEIDAEDHRRQKTQTAGESIHAIDQVIGIDDNDHRKIGQQEAEHFGQLINTQKPIHAPDLYITIVNDNKGSQYLTDKLFYRGNDEDIVFQPEEKNYKGGSYKILKISILIKMHRQK